MFQTPQSIFTYNHQVDDFIFILSIQEQTKRCEILIQKKTQPEFKPELFRNESHPFSIMPQYHQKTYTIQNHLCRT